MKRVILMAALACVWTSVAFASPVTGEKVNGFCDPQNFANTYLGTVFGVPGGIFALFSIINYESGKSAADIMRPPALSGLFFSAVIQGAISIAYKVKCDDYTAIE